MYEKISSMLDAVADSLESKGLLKEAFEIDKIADAIDAGVPYGMTTDLGNKLTSAANEIKKLGMRGDVATAVGIAVKALEDVTGHGLSADKMAQYKEWFEKTRSIPDLLKIMYNIILAGSGMSESKLLSRPE